MFTMQSETPDEILARISARFKAAVSITKMAARGEITGAVIFGAPGVGKTHTIEQTLNDENIEYKRISGTASAAGFYDLLYAGRDKGQVLLADDCDALLKDKTSLNLLKAVLDTRSKRRVSWNSRSLSETPSSFQFDGSIIFITNTDFQAEAQRGSSDLQAIIDRTLYLDLTIKTTNEILLWIKHVAIEGRMLESKNLTPSQCRDVMTFFEDNANKFSALSVRRLALLANLCSSSEDWESIAYHTLLT